MKTTLLLFLTLLLCAPAQAQSNDSLVVLFLSAPGTRLPVGLVLGDGNAARWDASGDGQPDLILTREDDAGDLRDILIVNPASLDTLWRVQDVPTTLGFNTGKGLELWGFVDVNGDDQREAIFTTDTEVRAYNPDSNELAYMLGLNQSARFLGAVDLTGDGYEELVVYLSDTRQVQVWTDPRPN